MTGMTLPAADILVSRGWGLSNALASAASAIGDRAAPDQLTKALRLNEQRDRCRLETRSCSHEDSTGIMPAGLPIGSPRLRTPGTAGCAPPRKEGSGTHTIAVSFFAMMRIELRYIRGQSWHTPLVLIENESRLLMYGFY